MSWDKITCNKWNQEWTSRRFSFVLESSAVQKIIETLTVECDKMDIGFASLDISVVHCKIRLEVVFLKLMSYWKNY